MEKLFKDLKEGEKFRIPGKVDQYSGQPHVLVKIPFMHNFYHTTGNKRNAEYIVSPSKMNDKYIFVEDDRKVEVV